MKQDLLLLIGSGDFTGFVRQFCAAHWECDDGEDERALENFCSTYKASPMTVDGLTVTLVDYEGGGEGEGEYVERNFRINDGETVVAHIQITGCYSSYYGIEWDTSVTRVYPKEVMVIQYVASP